MKKTFLLIPALLIALCFAGCKGHLEQGGAYAPGTNAVTVLPDGTLQTNFVATAEPDRPFLIADTAFQFAYAAIDAAFEIERNNRAMLWKISPNIKRSLDRIRPQAVRARDEYVIARAAYIANPVPPNLSTLELALAKVQQLSATATAALPK